MPESPRCGFIFAVIDRFGENGSIERLVPAFLPTEGAV
jgi:hypothetical protein